MMVCYAQDRYKDKVIMLPQIWQKEVVVEVVLSEQDNADWCPALPLLFSAKWNHYIGFYYDLVLNFFSTFQPFPYTADTFCMRLPNEKAPLSGTEIISHLFSLHAQPISQPLRLVCHFRGQGEGIPLIDLKRFFKYNLKASTCIRYGKFGSSVITVDMTVNNIDDMFSNFKENKLQPYLGETDSQSSNLGYRFIVESEKVKHMGVRIVGRDFTIERKVEKGVLLSSLWDQLGGNQTVALCLHGVKLREKEVTLGSLQRYCHPDGFLYFTLC